MNTLLPRSTPVKTPEVTKRSQPSPTPSRATVVRRFLDGTFPENRRPLDSWHQIITSMAEDLASAVAGFGLARTWPSGLHEIDGWPARARAYLGLGEVDRG